MHLLRYHLDKSVLLVLLVELVDIVALHQSLNHLDMSEFVVVVVVAAVVIDRY